MIPSIAPGHFSPLRLTWKSLHEYFFQSFINCLVRSMVVKMNSSLSISIVFLCFLAFLPVPGPRINYFCSDSVSITRSTKENLAISMNTRNRQSNFPHLLSLPHSLPGSSSCTPATPIGNRTHSMMISDLFCDEIRVGQSTSFAWDGRDGGLRNFEGQFHLFRTSISF